GTTPLIAAAQSGHEEIVRLLLTEYGYSDSERHAETSETALLLACDGGHKAIAEMLMQWGAHPENHDKKGRIALSAAACRSHTDIMLMLINDEQVDINAAPGVCWGSALDAAVDSGQIAAIELLL
ncbi:ankyrin repeat-containing domain protein, partial [Morchella snyderi]